MSSYQDQVNAINSRYQTTINEINTRYNNLRATIQAKEITAEYTAEDKEAELAENEENRSNELENAEGQKNFEIGQLNITYINQHQANEDIDFNALNSIIENIDFDTPEEITISQEQLQNMEDAMENLPTTIENTRYIYLTVGSKGKALQQLALSEYNTYSAAYDEIATRYNNLASQINATYDGYEATIQAKEITEQYTAEDKAQELATNEANRTQALAANETSKTTETEPLNTNYAETVGEILTAIGALGEEKETGFMGNVHINGKLHVNTDIFLEGKLNNIPIENLLTQSNLTPLITVINTKADVSHTHTLSDITNYTAFDNSTNETRLTTLENSITTKAEISHTHTLSDITNYTAFDNSTNETRLTTLENLITSKADDSMLTALAARISIVETDKADISHTHSEYAPINHNHDSVYASINHIHSEYSDINHNHDSSYASVNHNHNLDYAPLSHSHNEYAPINHNHDSSYASINHNHDTSYASINHNHDSVYASISHNHDTSYASINHNHDTSYASINHNHDSVYAPISHTHTHLDSLTVNDSTFENPHTTITTDAANPHFNIYVNDSLYNSYGSTVEGDNILFEINGDYNFVAYKIDETRTPSFILIVNEDVSTVNYIHIIEPGKFTINLDEYGSDNYEITFSINGDDETYYITRSYSNSYTPIQDNVINLKTLLNVIYPVGSIYTSMNNANPATLFGFGTWTQIIDKFLYCANSSGTTGGSKKITVENLPSHNHGFTGNAITGEIKNVLRYSGSDDGSWTANGCFSQSSTGGQRSWSGTNYNGDKVSIKFNATPSGTVKSTGSGTDYMPPFISVYAWYRSQ